MAGDPVRKGVLGVLLAGGVVPRGDDDCLVSS